MRGRNLPTGIGNLSRLKATKRNCQDWYTLTCHSTGLGLPSFPGHTGDGASELFRAFRAGLFLGSLSGWPLLGGTVDAPAHGDGTTEVHDADDDGGGLVALERGVYSQGQGGPKAARRGPISGAARSRGLRPVGSGKQLGLAGPGPVAAVVDPLPEMSAEVVPLAPRREGRGHGVLAGGASEDGPANPQHQAGQLWLREVR